eukprot:TRINITY_DN5172_c0_g1_i1.p1 TRINITY_DN5172_c0_g1~~TRINITY_DN5172_c0_g1_i1.p1  ORF type:complete len:686 (-),score=86.33 TRINITY_DN5172_c0_g1_i1:652-2709(-)
MVYRQIKLLEQDFQKMTERGKRFGILRTLSENLETLGEGVSTSGGRPSRRKPLKRRSRSVSERTDERKPSPKTGTRIPKWRSSGHFNTDDNVNSAFLDEPGLGRASSASLGFSFSIAGPAIVAQQEGKIERSNMALNCEPTHEEAMDIALEVKDDEDHPLACDAPMPITLKFSDVKYKVTLKRRTFSVFKNPCTEASVFLEKEILHGVTGSVGPGEVLAMMGPSGSGKTSLLNLLGGRTRQNASGSITYNDQPYIKSLKRRIGFVTQDDVLYPHLTVKETLTYAALLRLPHTLTKQQKKQRALEVIRDLGLERCQDTIIGGPFIKGVSGGERKRVCIGHEILIDPSVLFLDEPTSGLDSTTALRIVQQLQNIANAGRTVVTTIHQPSSRLFHKFDKLILLGEGSPLYFGKASFALDYFSSAGFSPLIAMNPADFLLDLAHGDVSDILVPKELYEETNEAETDARQSDKPSPKDVLQYLRMSYQSYIAPEAKEKLPASQYRDENRKFCTFPSHEWGATWWEQFSILFRRGLKERRHEYLSFLRFSQVLSVSFVLGFLWWQTRIDTPQRLEDQTGLLFFIAVFWGFFPVFMAIFTFPQERAMLAKERGVDMYRLSAYVVARNLSDLPLDLLLPIIFIGIVYFMTHLRMTVVAFCLTMLTVFLSIITSQVRSLPVSVVSHAFIYHSLE